MRRVTKNLIETCRYGNFAGTPLRTNGRKRMFSFCPGGLLLAEFESVAVDETWALADINRVKGARTFTVNVTVPLRIRAGPVSQVAGKLAI